MLSKPRRVFLPPVGLLANANTLIQHPADQASWIWHPDKAPKETAVLRFRLKFSLKEAAKPLVHVTADQRFQLRCDGQDVTFGPDRCDREHWTVQTVELDLAPGEHEFEALVWYITEMDGTVEGNGVSGSLDTSPAARPPMAQISWRGGFLLYGEGVPSSLLTTGEAAWTVEDITDSVTMTRPSVPHYLDVGPIFTFDMDGWAKRDAKPAVVILEPLKPNIHGVRRPSWCLYPAKLAEQLREPWSGGKIRAFRPSLKTGPWLEEETRGAAEAWQDLISKKSPITIGANKQMTVLWDLERYRCGYPVMKVEGGKGTLIQWNWAEALFEAASPEEIGPNTMKGNRNEIVGKVFQGLEDGWRIGSAKITETQALWWRCGRYIQLRITTGDEQVTLKELSMITTGYPLDRAGSWKSSDEGWDRLMPLFEHSYRIAGHETWTDTPYYEQMCYVGDNLLNALANYAWFGDARLSRRSVELYEWSRRASGFVAERYPSGWRQESSTFTLFWPLMIRDYAMWRDDVAFTKSMLPGMRSVLAEFEGLVHEDGLLHKVPGWPFVDWVPTWDQGCGPGVREGDSSIVNLQWVLALLAAAEVEEGHGDAILAERNRKLARRTMELIIARYWDEKRGLFVDTQGKSDASEHAQMFALLTGLLDAKRTEACLAAMRKGDGLCLATISSAFYTLEAMYLHGDADELHRRLAFWRPLPDMGFTATPEAPEPTRSDSHPWGAHPAYHTLASIAGVRPDAPSFAKVKIAPLPGKIDQFEAKVVHPKGFVRVAFKRSGGKYAATVNLPEGVTGSFVFEGKTVQLKPGKNEING